MHIINHNSKSKYIYLLTAIILILITAVSVCSVFPEEQEYTLTQVDENGKPIQQDPLDRAYELDNGGKDRDEWGKKYQTEFEQAEGATVFGGELIDTGAKAADDAMFNYTSVNFARWDDLLGGDYKNNIYNFSLKLSYVIVVFLALLYAFQYFMHPESVKTTPMRFLFTLVVVVVVLYISDTIVNSIYDTIQRVQVFAISNSGLGENDGNGLGVISILFLAFVTALGPMLLNPLIAVVAGIVLIIVVLITWPLIKQIIKTYIVCFERIVVCLFMLLLFPLAAATCVHESTKQIFSKYVAMIAGQVVLCTYSTVFLHLTVSSAKALGDMQNLGSGLSFFWAYVLILAFARLGQQFDRYLNAMGVNAIQTGTELAHTVGNVGRSLMNAVVYGTPQRAIGGVMQTMGTHLRMEGLYAAGKGLSSSSLMGYAMEGPATADNYSLSFARSMAKAGVTDYNAGNEASRNLARYLSDPRQNRNLAAVMSQDSLRQGVAELTGMNPNEIGNVSLSNMGVVFEDTNGTTHRIESDPKFGGDAVIGSESTGTFEGEVIGYHSYGNTSSEYPGVFTECADVFAEFGNLGVEDRVADYELYDSVTQMRNDGDTTIFADASDKPVFEVSKKAREALEQYSFDGSEEEVESFINLFESKNPGFQVIREDEYFKDAGSGEKRDYGRLNNGSYDFVVVDRKGRLADEVANEAGTNYTTAYRLRVSGGVGKRRSSNSTFFGNYKIDQGEGHKYKSVLNLDLTKGTFDPNSKTFRDVNGKDMGRFMKTYCTRGRLGD